MSLVARQMTSNTVVSMRDVMQMYFVGFSIQIKRDAVAESVVLFTHCRVHNVVSLVEERTQE